MAIPSRTDSIEQYKNEDIWVDRASRPRYSYGSKAKGMVHHRDLEELKALGAGRPAPEAVVALYRRAFEDYGVRALWSRTPSKFPTIAQALIIAQSLRREGDMRARPLAVQIEEACRAAV